MDNENDETRSWNNRRMRDALNALLYRYAHNLRGDSHVPAAGTNTGIDSAGADFTERACYPLDRGGR